jgi:hypothetical protein
MKDAFTILEIGSGSFKLHKNGYFSLRFQSSLGKDLIGNSLNPNSVAIAMKSLKTQILPFLKEHEICPNDVLVFATAAIRRAMKDKYGSGRDFVKQIFSLGFSQVKVFSEDEECNYAAWAVLEEIKDLHSDFLMLDTGGASHQLVEFRDQKIFQKTSVPIGSHSDIANLEMPDFVERGFSQRLPLVIIGTTGLIINNLKNLSRNSLTETTLALEAMDLKQRREFLQIMIENKNIHELFVDFRLAVLPNAFKIVCNCAENLQIDFFLESDKQAMDFVSKYGFVS